MSITKNVPYIDFPLPKGVKELRLRHIGWLPRLNKRKDYGTPRELEELTEQFVDYGGWNQQFQPIAELAAEDEATEILQSRKAIHGLLKAKAEAADKSKPEGALAIARLDFFESEYIDDKGEFYVPLLIGTSGNRRGSIVNEAGAKCKVLGKDFDTRIAVQVPNFPGHRFQSAVQRTEEQVMENEKKLAGNLEMNDVDLLDTVYDLVTVSGATQSDIRRLTRTPVQGLRRYFAARMEWFINSKLGKEVAKRIRWLSRLTEGPYLDPNGKPTWTDKEVGSKEKNSPNPDFLVFRNFDQNAFQGEKNADKPAYKFGPMGNRCEVQARFDEVNKERAAGANPLPKLVRPTEADITAWIAHYMDDQRSSTAMMTKQVINNHADSECGVVKTCFTAVQKANSELLRPLIARKDGLDSVMVIPDAAYPQVETILLGLSMLSAETITTLLSGKFETAVEKAVAIAEKEKASAAAEAAKAAKMAPKAAAEVEETADVE